MAIDGYMVFENYPLPQRDRFLKSESQVIWDDDSVLGKDTKFIDLSAASKALGLFEIEEWSFGVERVLSTASQSGGIGTGSATFNEFTINRKIDRASPILFEMACSGTTFKNVSLALRKGAGGKSSGAVYLRYDFRLVGVKTVNWSHGEDSPTEEVAFEYGAVRLSYQPQKPDGTFDAKVVGGWNRITNRQDIEDKELTNKS